MHHPPRLPPRSMVAWGEDTTGNEKYTMRVKDLATGRQLLARPIPDTAGNVAWGDNSTLFYVTKDALDRWGLAVCLVQGAGGSKWQVGRSRLRWAGGLRGLWGWGPGGAGKHVAAARACGDGKHAGWLPRCKGMGRSLATAQPPHLRPAKRRN